MAKRTNNTITVDMVEEILEHSVFSVDTVFDKCTVVACKLPNGFVIVESSACVDPANYDEDMGVDICLKAIKRKIWGLEGYKLQDVLGNFDDDLNDADDDYDECDGDCEHCDLAGDNSHDDNTDDDSDYWDDVMDAYNTYLDYFDYYLNQYAKVKHKINHRHGIR